MCGFGYAFSLGFTVDSSTGVVPCSNWRGGCVSTLWHPDRCLPRGPYRFPCVLRSGLGRCPAAVPGTPWRSRRAVQPDPSESCSCPCLRTPAVRRQHNRRSPAWRSGSLFRAEASSSRMAFAVLSTRHGMYFWYGTLHELDRGACAYLRRRGRYFDGERASARTRQAAASVAVTVTVTDPEGKPVVSSVAVLPEPEILPAEA